MHQSSIGRIEKSKIQIFQYRNYDSSIFQFKGNKNMFPAVKICLHVKPIFFFRRQRYNFASRTRHARLVPTSFRRIFPVPFVDDEESLCLEAEERISPSQLILTMDYVNGHSKATPDLFCSLTIPDVDSTVCYTTCTWSLWSLPFSFSLCQVTRGQWSISARPLWTRGVIVTSRLWIFVYAGSANVCKPSVGDCSLFQKHRAIAEKATVSIFKKANEKARANISFDVASNRNSSNRFSNCQTLSFDHVSINIAQFRVSERDVSSDIRSGINTW